MKAIGTIVLCFQLSANFPSWTSRVRSAFSAFGSKALQSNQISHFQTCSIGSPLDVKLRFKLDVVRWCAKRSLAVLAG